MSENSAVKELVSHHLSALMHAKEKCLKSVLRQVLGREPSLEDAKLLVLAHGPRSISDSAFSKIYFDGVYLGDIEENMLYVKFTPAKNTKPTL